MATTINRTQVRQEVLRRLPTLGRALSADSITKAGPSITHVSEYERQRAGLTSYEGQYVHRYNLTDPDRWRRITTVDTTNGIISVDGPAYVDGTDLAYERLGVHPDVINGFIAEAQRRQRVRTNIALVGNYTHDYDMETSGTAYWDGSLGGSNATATTLSKITSDVRSGIQALQGVATANTAGIWGETCNVKPNTNCYMAFIFRCPVLTGSFTLGIRDATNNTTLFSRTISGVANSEWLACTLPFVTGTTTTQVNPQFITTATGDTWIVDTCFGPYEAGQTDFTLQTGMDEAYKLRAVRPSTFKSPLATNSGFFSAESLEFMGDFTSPENYTVEAFRRDTNAKRLRFIPSVYYPDPLTSPGSGYGSGFGGLYPTVSQQMRPVWLAMEAQVSEFEPLLTETSTTSQPLDVCASWTIKLLAEYIMGRNPTPYWQGVWNEYKSYAAYEEMLRPPQPLMPQRRFHQVRI